jgi:hypothetical protein
MPPRSHASRADGAGVPITVSDPNASDPDALGAGWIVSTPY